jgi:SAM-dependent methyltransferase
MLRFIRSRCGKLVRALKTLVFPILYHGQARWCPVCENRSRKFLLFGDPKRSDALCPGCGSLERHRLVWLYFQRMTDLFNGAQKKILHVAPEPCLASRLQRRLGEGCLSADLQDPAAMVKMDVTNIQFPAESFDVIYCSHVLEHVMDDRKAMREFYRILKPGGWAVLLVPISAERTVEDLAIVKPNERLKAFGQEDHVRRYGPDYVERLREAGFMVKISRPSDLCGDEEIARLGLTAASGEIYCCLKP